MTSHNKLYYPVDEVKLQDLHDWSTSCSAASSPPCPSSRPSSPSTETRPPSSPAVAKPTGTRVNVNEEDLVLFRLHQEVLGVQQKCPHAGGPLHLGDIETLPDGSTCVRCPWHRWCFDLRTGKLMHPEGRSSAKARVYPVKVNLEDGTLSVGFDALNSKYLKSEQV